LLQGLFRWLAPLVTLAFTWAVLHFYEVGLADSAAVTGYLLFGVTLPGMLVWRWLRGRTDVFYLDAGAGFAVGCALQLAAYLPGRWAGFPELVLLVPILVLAVFIGDRGLRRWLRGSPPGSVWGAWFLALAVMLGVSLVALSAFRYEPLDGYGAGYVYVDIPFHLALAGELKHHMPFTTPYLHGVPLQYHWYAHAHVAATSWATGVEIEVLIRRIVPIAMLIACIVATAGLAQGWARRRWTGPVAAAALLVVFPITVYGWQRHTPSTLLDVAWWASPSQSFGQVMVVPAVALLVQIVRKRRMSPPGVWILFALSVAAVMAAKATMVPLLLAAVCMACGSWLVFRGRLHLPSLTALGIVVGGLAFAQFVIFGGASQGTALRPFDAVERSRDFYGFEVQPGTTWSVTATVVAVIVHLYGYLLLAAGMFAFGRRLVTSPGVAALLGVAIAGQGAALVFIQHGGSERYFVRSAATITIPMAVWGIALLVRRFTLGVRLAMLIAFLAGPPVALLISWQTYPMLVPSGNWEALLYLLAPIGAALLASVLVGVLVSRLGRLLRLRVSAAALAFVMLMGMGTLPTYRVVARYDQAVAANGWDHVVVREGPADIPWRGKEAARFLRLKSAPDELVATNAHCRIPERARCDSRAFWLSGYAERRVLLEGWGYTVQANLAAEREGAIYGRFWDPELEARNDGVFLDPNPNTAGILKERYGVDILFVDERVGEVDPERMAVIATRIYDRGEVEIWRLR
jgi:hypothetical protein